jgi:hypothetical protein
MPFFVPRPEIAFGPASTFGERENGPRFDEHPQLHRAHGARRPRRHQPARAPRPAAYLDGRPVKFLGANHAFLAVIVPAGEHRLRLTFLPKSFVIGRVITFAALLGIIIFLFFTRISPRRGSACAAATLLQDDDPQQRQRRL